MRQRLKLLACLCALLCLCSCSLMDSLPPALKPTAHTGAANLPDLRQLRMPEAPQNPWQPTDASAADTTLQVDLWLDASQVMGGINPHEESLYPHRGNRYREGGFHYHFDDQIGWYETLLRDLLSAAEGSRIRILRSGNEHLTDQQLLASGLAASDAPDALRTLRRDLLTYAIDPMPSIFSGFAADNMKDSFYSLFSPQMNQLPQLISAGQQPLLENPTKAQQMSDYLASMIAAYDPKEADDHLQRSLTDDFSPMMQALTNLDTRRLSVITFDPLTLRRLSGTAVDGTPQAYLENLLRDLGLFENGLAVELYAFQLDYLGQIHTIASADLVQPLIWGRLDFIANKGEIRGPLPMPRTLLMLVVGQPAQVDTYTSALNSQLAADPGLKGLRGPEKGQLTYSQSGQTITQQPFTFRYETTRIQRHGVEPYTLAGSDISVTKGQGTLLSGGSQPTVALASDQAGPCQVTAQWPLTVLEGGLQLDSDQLSDLRIEGVASLLLTDTLPNAPDAKTVEGTQTLTYRDTLYQFTYTETDVAHPFKAEQLTIDEAQQTLRASLTCDAAELTPGYYRLLLRADITGAQLSWPDVPWISALNANITNQQLVSWQQMSQAVNQHAKNSTNIPNFLWHAWGDISGNTYLGTTIPDCPPVYAAPRLSELFAQLKSAAQIESLPFIYLPLDVFVAPSNQLPTL